MEFEKMLYSSNTAQQMPTQNQQQPLSQYKLDETVANQFLQAPEAQYAAYADNFDLSLLPQENIPTTVFQYNNEKICHPSIEAPQIKIEQTWCTSSADDAKQEQVYTPLYDAQLNNLQPQQYKQQSEQQAYQLQQQQYTRSCNRLIPPPAYPYNYPSPQSSPAQSAEYNLPFQAYNSGCYDSLSSLYVSSPSPSLDTACIKQELHILPPSPPESNCETPSPRGINCIDNIKAEPLDADVESLIDLNALLEKPYSSLGETCAAKQEQKHQQQQQPEAEPERDHQVLREYLADNTFQKKHNLKPLALESFIGGLAEVRGDFEPVISLALEHVKREADAICAELQISQDPSAWSPTQVHAWLRSTIAQFKLPQNNELETKFCENGAALMLLTEEEFMRRLPESGSTLHAQLEIWKMAYADGYQHNATTPVVIQPVNAATTLPTQDLWQANFMPSLQDMQNDSDVDNDDDDDDMAPTTTNNLTQINTVANANTNSTNVSTNLTQKRINGNAGSSNGTGARNGSSHIHLWQFLKELLAAPQINGTAIRWIDRSKGIFKIEDSVRVAKLWGRRKNRPAMNYDKLSRSIRQYYKKGIMKKTERSQRLVYQFCHPYHQ